MFTSWAWFRHPPFLGDFRRHWTVKLKFTSDINTGTPQSTARAALDFSLYPTFSGTGV